MSTNRLLALVLMGLVLANCSKTPKGTDVGSGGDVCELEYKGLIPAATEWIKKTQRGVVNAEAFTKALRQTPVDCTKEELFFKGVSKSALSTTDPLLTKLNYDRFNSADKLGKQALLIHEGLVLIGVEKTDDYHISNQLWDVVPNGFYRFVCGEVFLSLGIAQASIELVQLRENDGYEGRLNLGYQADFESPQQSVSIPFARRFQCLNSVADPKRISCSDDFTLASIRTFASEDRVNLRIRSNALETAINWKRLGWLPKEMDLVSSPLAQPDLKISFEAAGCHIDY